MNNFDERWTLRISRVQEVRDLVANRAALDFYRTVLEFQAGVSRRFQLPAVPGRSLRDQIDVSLLGGEFPLILELSASQGPALLRSEAEKLSEAGQEAWRKLMSTSLSSTNPSLDAIHDFFARACLQPVAENLQIQVPKDAHYIGNSCPTCGGLPQIAVLRPEGEGASRSLFCSFCFCEWSFRRVICPCCGEEDKERLPRYSSEEWTYVHIEACETCKRYLKSVDLSVNGLAVPLVDEAAAAVLDVWAVDRGYSKIVPNLIGF